MVNNNVLIMDRKEVSDYCGKNLYATMRFYNASEDYIAARCCILNGLFSGFILACQAIEKVLKAIIYLETGKKIKNGHNPYELKEQLKKIKDYDIDHLDVVLNKLYNWYKSRYHENGLSGGSTEELKLVDELWLILVEKLPMPDEVKYRMKFFADLFEDGLLWNSRYWIMQYNQPLGRNIEDMKKRYKEVIQHLYKK